MNRVKSKVWALVNSLSAFEHQLNDQLSIWLFGQRELEDYKDLPLPSERKQDKQKQKTIRPRERNRGQLQLLFIKKFKRSLLSLIELTEYLFRSKKKEVYNNYY